MSCQTVKPGIDCVKGLHFSFGILGGIFHHFIQILKEHSASKQWRPLSEATGLGLPYLPMLKPPVSIRKCLVKL